MVFYFTSIERKVLRAARLLTCLNKELSYCRGIAQCTVSWNLVTWP